MKTLFERLSEESRVKLETEAMLYPSTMIPIINQLNTMYYWAGLPIETCMRIHDVTCGGGFDLSEFINLFDEL